LPGVTVLSEPGRHGAQTILVLGGGNALGSYLAGAYETLSGAGIEPDWIVGASAGALMGAIIAGNRPEQRLPRLREFWDEAMTKTGPAPFANEKLRQHYNGWHALWSVVAGRPAARCASPFAALTSKPARRSASTPRGIGSGPSTCSPVPL
jgi:predicted acylesterase/phospholipase RssA